MMYLPPARGLRSAVAGGATLLAALAAGCSAQPRLQADAASRCRPNAVPPRVARSPYDLNEIWMTDTGARIRLADLRGKPRIMAMFFANCQGVCLLTVEHMKEVEASLPTALRDKMGFVLITLDPARDTAEKLAAYRHENGLPASTWALLRGEDAATAALADRLAITFSRESNRGFVHSSGITLIDADGNIVQQELGNHPDLAAMVLALKAMLNKETVAAGGLSE